MWLTDLHTNRLHLAEQYRYDTIVRIMKKYITGVVLTLLFATALPHTSDAYFTSKQTAAPLTDTTGLYTITYSFGLPKQDIYLPIKTERNLMHGNGDSTLGYTVRTENNVIANDGIAAAIVLSDAEVKDGMYFVPAGESATFTLVAFYKAPAMTPMDGYKLQVEHLPFPVDLGEGDMQIRSLNPSELQYYVTEGIYLGTPGK